MVAKPAPDSPDAAEMAGIAPPPRKLGKRQSVICPFTIVVDSREGLPYEFAGLRSNADKHDLPLIIPSVRECLPVGDYSILGMPDVVIERKSPADLYGSVSRRDNFIGRLEKMSEIRLRGGFAAVVVESNFDELLRSPPHFSKLHPRSLSRTIRAWEQRYHVNWCFFAGRDWAEAATFRMLERFWLDHKPIDAKRPDNSTN